MTTQAIRASEGGCETFNKLNVRQIVTAATNDTALANPAATTTKPTSGVIDTEKHGFVRLFFGGTTTANQTVNYQVIAWFPWTTAAGVLVWVPSLVAKGVFTLGATATPTQFTAANGLLADTITDTLSAGGTVVRSPADDSVGFLKVGTHGAPVLQVQTDRATGAVTADAWAQLCDN